MDLGIRGAVTSTTKMPAGLTLGSQGCFAPQRKCQTLCKLPCQLAGVQALASGITSCSGAEELEAHCCLHVGVIRRRLGGHASTAMRLRRTGAHSALGEKAT